MSRRQRTDKYSFTCTDEVWERIKALAARRGMSASAYIVESALTVDLEEEDALTVDEQRAMYASLLRTEKAAVSAQGDGEGRLSVLESFYNRIAYLTHRSMQEMILGGREGELMQILSISFGKDEARKKIDTFRRHLFNE